MRIWTIEENSIVQVDYFEKLLEEIKKYIERG